MKKFNALMLFLLISSFCIGQNDNLKKGFRYFDFIELIPWGRADFRVNYIYGLDTDFYQKIHLKVLVSIFTKYQVPIYLSYDNKLAYKIKEYEKKRCYILSDFLNYIFLINNVAIKANENDCGEKYKHLAIDTIKGDWYLLSIDKHLLRFKKCPYDSCAYLWRIFHAKQLIKHYSHDIYGMHTIENLSVLLVKAGVPIAYDAYGRILMSKKEADVHLKQHNNFIPLIFRLAADEEWMKKNFYSGSIPYQLFPAYIEYFGKYIFNSELEDFEKGYEKQVER